MIDFIQPAMSENQIFSPTDFDDESQNKFLIETLLNYTDNSIVLTDKNLNIIFFNKLASEWSVLFTGKSLHKGMSLLELSSPEKKQEQLKVFSAMLNGNFYETETELKLPDKEYACFNSSFQPAKNNKGEIVGILITSKNITERKRKEEELRMSNERYQLISQATSDATWDYDLVNNDVYWNESLFKFFDHSYSEDINGYQLWEKYIHPEDKAWVISSLDTAVKSGKRLWSEEYRFIKGDGTVVYVYDRGMVIRNEAGEPVRMIGSMQDITKQKENEIRIALSEHRFKSLIQSGTDLIGIVDAQGFYTYVSPTVTQLGYDLNFLIGKNAFDFIHPDDISMAQKYFEAVFKEKKITSEPFRFKHANGEWRLIETVVTNLLDDPAINGIVVNSKDITEKHEKDEALQKAVNDLNKILDSSVDVIVVTDENNRYIQVSAAAETVWGYKPEELIGKICLDMVHPDDVAHTNAITEKVMKGTKLTNFENRYIRKDGTIVPLIWSARWDENEKVMYAIARDATEKVDAEVALKKSEENYRYLFENNPLPMFAFDTETFEFIMVNEASVEFYGYSKEEFKKITLLELRPEDEREKLKKFIATAKHSTGIKRISGWKHLKKDGTIVEVDTVGHNVTIGNKACRLSVIYDVTERNKARAELQKSEAMFRTISESFPNGIVSILDKDLRFMYVAGKELESLKVPSSYFVGTVYDHHIPDEDLAIRSMADKVFAGEAMVSEMRFFERNYLVSSVPLYEVDGSIERILVVFQNITTQKRVQKEKELLINELTKNIHDLRQFSYITSHNLRAPISNLIGIMGLIDMDSIKDPDTIFLVEKFKESTFILNETVNDLLNILLIKNNVNVKKEAFSLQQVWQDVCISVSSQIRNAGAEINIDFFNASDIVFNKSYAESILLNLLTNSLKYRHKDRKLQINLSTSEEEDFLVLHFCDNGIGINLEHHRHKIFGLYQRFHNYTDSKGLGLYIVHSQITALGGKIEVESEIDKGTCFNIYFKKITDATQGFIDR